MTDTDKETQLIEPLNQPQGKFNVSKADLMFITDMDNRKREEETHSKASAKINELGLAQGIATKLNTDVNTGIINFS